MPSITLFVVGALAPKSYAMEEPITVIKNGGYTDLIDDFLGASFFYSYVYKGEAGYLDYALASNNLLSQVTGIFVWQLQHEI
jgi:predicted extracellular nuclease